VINLLLLNYWKFILSLNLDKYSDFMLDVYITLCWMFMLFYVGRLLFYVGCLLLYVGCLLL